MNNKTIILNSATLLTASIFSAIIAILIQKQQPNLQTLITLNPTEAIQTYIVMIALDAVMIAIAIGLLAILYAIIKELKEKKINAI